MDTRLKVERPDEIVFTMTITMKAKEWEQLREQLTNDYPGWTLSRSIDDLLTQARKIYWPREDHSLSEPSS